MPVAGSGTSCNHNPGSDFALTSAFMRKLSLFESNQFQDNGIQSIKLASPTFHFTGKIHQYTAHTCQLSALREKKKRPLP
jgi:hypothetical protein